MKQKHYNIAGYIWITLCVFILLTGLAINSRNTNKVEIPTNKIKSLYNERNSKGELFLQIPKTNLKTEIEKMTEMRDYYGSKLDNDGLLTFYIQSKKAGVDPIIPFCIAVVDSQLGTRGKGARTKNPCNYGNTSGGGIKRYKRYRDGLMACYKGLIRPQYRNTNNISDLSVGGRLMTGRDGTGDWNNGTKVWATSPENWNVNITNCISEIKGISKEEALVYNFRK